MFFFKSRTDNGLDKLANIVAAAMRSARAIEVAGHVAGTTSVSTSVYVIKGSLFTITVTLCTLIV